MALTDHNDNDKPTPKFVNIPRFAEITGMSQTTAKNRCKNGSIPAEPVERNAAGDVLYVISREVAERISMGIDPGKKRTGRPKSRGRRA